MPIAEGLHRASGQNQHTYWPPLSHQRHTQKSASFPDPQRFNKSELGIGLDVLDLHSATLKHNPTDYVPSVDGEWMAVHVFLKLRGKAVARDTMIFVAVGKCNRRSFRTAQLCRRCNQGIEHLLQVKCGTADNLENVGCRCLLLQRLPQFAQQPRVLDGNNSLGCEAPEKLDFTVVESSYLLPVDNYCPNYFTVFEHRHHKEGSHAADLRKSNRVLIGLVGSHMLPYVSNLDDLFGLSHTQ